jgi:tetraacyldisaccharide-1-P 4'-kinase
MNSIIVCVGNRGTGKTTAAVNLALDYLKRYPNRKVVFYDQNETENYSNYPFYSPKLKGIISKIIERDYKALLTLTNTLIILEDCLKYLKTEDDINTLILDSKQKGNDILFINHWWGVLPPTLLRCADYFMIFPSDDPKQKKKFIGSIVLEAAIKQNQAKPLKDKNGNTFYKPIFIKK